MKSVLIDLLGQRFGRLMVVKRAANDRRGEARWNCLCNCGNKSIVLGSHLRSGCRSKPVKCVENNQRLSAIPRTGLQSISNPNRTR